MVTNGQKHAKSGSALPPWHVLREAKGQNPEGHGEKKTQVLVIRPQKGA